MKTSYVVDPDGKFNAAVTAAIAEVDDLRIPFILITKSWFKSNQAIFALQGPGKYKDLSKAYKDYKTIHYGSPYPILVAKGHLRDSMTNATDRNSINMVVGKYQLWLGTKIPYAKHLQFGTKFMPARPPVLLGPEQVAPKEINERQNAWIKILESYVLQACKKVGKVRE